MKAVAKGGGYGGLMATLVSPTIEDVQWTITEHFPRLWPGVEAALATVAQLKLKDAVNCPALIYYAPPSAGKTTVIEMLDGHWITYRSDKFTPASFVTHQANKSEKELGKIDLLPRIRYRCLLTPELAPTFSGREDQIRERLSVLITVLDGRGYTADSGAQGKRGCTGDYLFSWLGATVPFQQRTWEIMGHMGSRLLFWRLPELEMTPEELVREQEGPSYGKRVRECKTVLHAFLDGLFGSGPPTQKGVEDGTATIRGAPWDANADPYPVKLWVARLAKLVCASRNLGERESRVATLLTNFARGLALLRGRTYLTPAELRRTIQVAVNSIPDEQRTVLVTLRRQGGILLVSDAEKIWWCSYDTAKARMERCHGPVMEFVKKGRSTHLRLQPDYGWYGQLPPEPDQPFATASWLTEGLETNNLE